MGWFSSIASSAGDLMSDLFQSKKAAQRQFQYQREMMQNAHQWEVQDLRKAGLNPILSAGGSGASGSVGAPVVSSGRLSSSMAHSARRVEQIINNKTAGLLEAQTDAQRALANQYSASAKQMNENTKTVERLNRYFDQHPEVFRAGQVNQALPGLKSIPGVLEYLNSAHTQGVQHRSFKPSKRFEENMYRGID